MHRQLYLIILTLCISYCSSYADTTPIRVACVGDSITYGACVADREKNCYPAVLGGLMGEKYDVRNFGVSGATLLKKGDHPWWNVDAFKNATAFNPNVVVIKLGSNDTKPQNWKFKDEFAPDYKDMIDQFKKLPSSPRIFICRPAFVAKSLWHAAEKIRDEVSNGTLSRTAVPCAMAEA